MALELEKKVWSGLGDSRNPLARTTKLMPLWEKLQLGKLESLGQKTKEAPPLPTNVQPAPAASLPAKAIRRRAAILMDEDDANIFKPSAGGA